jgi:quercetin dioxygenase-like cupin family protein
LNQEPVVLREAELEWETWEEDDGVERDSVFWKTLLSDEATGTQELTVGVAKMPPGGTLREHRHRQAEVYLMLAGSGSVRVGGEPRSVEAGSAVFIPGDAVHSCENTGASELRVAYILAADSFDDVEYVFEN